MSPLSNATTLANYASGIGTQGATLEIDSNNKRVGIGTTNPQGPEGSLQVGTAVTISGNSGIVSATTFHGDFGSSTSVAGNLTVSGVITYEDVTNVDSIGIMTARSGLRVTDSGTKSLRVITGSANGASALFQSNATGTGDNDGLFIGNDSAADGYLWNYENKSLLLGTNNTERLRIDSSGNIGVGGAATSNSSTKTLQVTDSTTSRVLLEATNSGGRKYGWYSSTDGQFAVYDYTASSERLRIDSSGRMGLGTASPSYNLVVSGTGGVSSRTIATDAGGDSSFFVQNNNGSIAGPLTYGTTKTAYGALGSDETAFYSNRSTTILADGGSSVIKFAAGGNTERMRIDNLGRIGIGEVPSTNSGPFNVRIDNGSFHLGYGTNYDNYYTTGSSGTHIFRNGGTEQMRIDSSGRMGLGTNSPDTTLTVGGTNGAIRVQPSNVANASIFLRHGSVATNSGLEADSTGALGLYSNGSERARIDNSGRLLLGVNSAVAGNQDYKGLFSSSANSTHNTFGLQYPGVATWGFSVLNNADLRIRRDGNDYIRVDSNGRLLVGTSSARVIDGATQLLQVEAADGSGTGRMAIGTNNNDNATGGGIYLFRSRGGTLGSNTIVQDNDDLGSIYFHGADGTDITSRAAQIRCEVDGTPGANDMPGRLVFSTTADGASSITERMRINSSGSTKFTPSSSSATLQIEPGTVNSDSIRLQSGGTTSTYLEYRGYLGHAWFVDTTERMRIDSSGRLVIGQTSSPNAGSGQYAKLASVGNTALATGDGRIMLARGKTAATMSNGNDVGGVEFTDNTGASFAAVRAQVNGTPGGVNGNPGALLFCTEEVGSDNGAAEKMRIDSSGRVLIGTTFAGQGSADDLTVGDTSGHHGITIRSSSTSTGNIFFSDTNNSDSASYSGFIQYYHTNSKMYFGNNTASRMLLGGYGFFHASNISDFSGDLSNTNSFHSLASNISQWTTQIKNTNNSPYGLYVYHLQTLNNSGNNFIYCGDSLKRFTVMSNGGIENFSGNNSNLCDEREKKNIVSLDTKWDKVKSWELKKFHYKEDADTDDLRYGVIAQQVETVCPEVLTEWEKQSAAEAELDEDGNVVTPAREQIMRKGVKEQQMMWMAIKALQEAQARIETLETANADLVARVAALEG